MNRQILPTRGSSIGCENVRQWLRELRIAHDESFVSLGCAVDLDRKTLMAYELGKRVPKVDHLFRIAEHYGLDEIRFKMTE